MNKFPIDKPSEQRHMDHRGGGNYALVLLWAELEYDIRYALWRRMRVSAKDEASKSTSITDEDDKDFLLRTFTEAISTLKGRLKPYVTERSRIASDELLEAPSQFSISLHFDKGWLGDADTMLNLAHSFVVDHTAAELMMLNNDPLADTYQGKAQSCLNKIYDEANSFNLEDSPIYHI